MASETAPKASDIKSPVEGLIRALEKKAQADAEQRVTPRFPVHLSATLVRMDDLGRLTPYATVYIADISLGGVCMLCESRCPDGAEYLLNLESVLGKECFLPIRAMQCRKVLGSTYRVGAAFIKALSNAE